MLALTLLTPLLAFAGATLGVVLNRRGARELESRSLREETMRNVRWAAELASSETVTTARLGIAQLRALARLPELDRYEVTMVGVALATMEERLRRDEEARTVREVEVTVLQQEVAQALIEVRERLGEPIDDWTRRVAAAQPRPKPLGSRDDDLEDVVFYLV